MERYTLSAKRASEEVWGVSMWRARKGKEVSYIVKRFNVMDGGARTMLIAELNSLIACPASLAVVPIDAFLDGLEVALVLEDGGEVLRDLMDRCGRVTEQNAAIVLRQVVQALRYLHETLRLVHNHVDASSLLVSRVGEVKLSSFGYSAPQVVAAGDGSMAPRRLRGAFVHMSPERLLGLDCSFAADVWSLGVLSIEMMTGRGPYDMASFAGGDGGLFRFKQAVVAGPSPSLPRGAESSHDARLFVDACLHKDLKLRATLPVLQSHVFLAKFENFATQFLGRWVGKSKRLANKLRKDSSAGMAGLRARQAAQAGTDPARPADGPQDAPQASVPPAGSANDKKKGGQGLAAQLSARHSIFAAINLAFDNTGKPAPPKSKSKSDSDSDSHSDDEPGA